MSTSKAPSSAADPGSCGYAKLQSEARRGGEGNGGEHGGRTARRDRGPICTVMLMDGLALAGEAWAAGYCERAHDALIVQL
jgi:hypothetical protein